MPQLTDSQVHLLRRLEREVKVRAQHVCSGHAIQDLEILGLVRRAHSFAGDTMFWVITQRGKELLSNLPTA